MLENMRSPQPQHSHKDLANSQRHISQSRSVCNSRNSSIELLRIVAMIMIVGHHYVYSTDATFFLQQPFSIKELLYLFIQSLGKVGVFIFFAISAWYLCSPQNTSVRKTLERIWILEREVLFYSLGLLIVSLIFDRSALTRKDIILSIFPTMTSLWWYITAYAVFLLFVPFLNIGLYKIGRKKHAALSSIMLFIWGICKGLLPGNIFDLDTENFIGFIYLYIVISFYRWYLNNWGKKVAVALIATGTFLTISSIAILQIIGTYAHIDSLRTHSIFETNSYFKTFVILTGFGLLLLFEQYESHNRFINILAKTTLGVYLIHQYPTVNVWLWKDWFNCADIYDKPHGALISLVAIIITFVGCACIDLIREGIFKITIDRHHGYGFERFTNAITRQTWYSKTMNYLCRSYSEQALLHPRKHDDDIRPS